MILRVARSRCAGRTLRACDDRQRQRLPLTRTRHRLPHARVRHLRTRPYRPRTNGKAERFIRTMLGGWAHGAIYGSSAGRIRALTGWLEHDNRRRPHGSLNHQPPLNRLAQLRNDVPGTYS
jgi:transposase InsO family protein